MPNFDNFITFVWDKHPKMNGAQRWETWEQKFVWGMSHDRANYQSRNKVGNCFQFENVTRDFTIELNDS